MSPTKVLISAPINATSFDASRARNQAIAARLREHGFDVLDPLDSAVLDRALKGQVGDLDGRAQRQQVATPHAIVWGSRRLVAEADAVLFCLAELDYEPRATWGVPIELAWANELSKFRVAVGQPNNVWVQQLTNEHVRDFDRALEKLIAWRLHCQVRAAA